VNEFKEAIAKTAGDLFDNEEKRKYFLQQGFLQKILFSQSLCIPNSIAK